MDSLIIVIVIAMIALVIFKRPDGKKNTGNIHDKQLSSVKGAEFTGHPVMNASENQLYDFFVAHDTEHCIQRIRSAAITRFGVDRFNEI